MVSKGSILFLAAFLSLSSTNGAHSAGTYMELIGKGYATPAAKSFCTQMRAICNTSSGATIVQLTSAKKAQLQAVNRSVNTRIQERSDLETSGIEDRWSIPTRYGDCEDFAILKKRELMKQGWPAAALLLTVVRLRFSGEGHVVLTVRTSEGDLILDNHTNAIRDWSKTSYRYYARQTQKGAGWQRIGAALPLNATTSPRPAS
jgi:predicted transglutaminase-like cysteine proteinase